VTTFGTSGTLSGVDVARVLAHADVCGVMPRAVWTGLRQSLLMPVARLSDEVEAGASLRVDVAFGADGRRAWYRSVNRLSGDRGRRWR
jgi:hypothetical protein